MLTNRCSRCGKGPIVTDNSNGEVFCGSCGFVIMERSEELGPEWRAFSKEEHERRSRTGFAISLAMHDMGLSTIIGLTDKDASGRSLSASAKSMIERLRTWDSRSKTEPFERNLRQAFIELDRLKDKIGANNAVLEKAAYIYRKMLDKNLTRGRLTSAMIAAALYIACRNAETPRTLKDIVNASDVDRKNMARCYRVIVKALDIRVPVSNPVKYIARIAANARLSEKTKRVALEIIKKAEKGEISGGKDPMGFAAGALYLASLETLEYRTQSDLARAAGITEVTIRNRCTDLRKYC